MNLKSVIVATVIALVVVVGTTATACDTPPAQNQYFVYGPPQPHFRTPVRSALWSMLQPVAYSQPVYPVQVVQPCPKCGRVH